MDCNCAGSTCPSLHIPNWRGDAGPGSNSSSKSSDNRVTRQKAKQWLLFVGDCHELGEALAKKPNHPSWLALRFLDALLRGYSEIVFANNPITGLLFVAGITVADPYVSLCGLTTGVIGLLAALATQQPKKAICAGIPVFCPILIGLVTSSLLPIVYGLEMNYRFWLYMIVGAIFSMYLTSAFGTLLGSIGRYPMPCFSVPFVTVQAMLFLCIVNSPYYPPPTASPPQNLSIERLRRDLNATGFNPETTDVFSNIISSNVSSTDNTLLTGLNIHAIDPKIPDNITSSNPSSMVLNSTNFNPKDSELLANTASSNSSNIDSSLASPNFNHKDVELLPHITVLNGSNTGSLIANTSFNPTDVELLPNVTSDTTKAATSLGTDVITREEDIFNDIAKLQPVPKLQTIGDSGNDSQPGTEPATYNTTMEDVEYLHDPNHIDWGQVFTGVLLSMSQVFGLNNAPAAALMYLGVLIFSPTTGLMCLVGATISTLTGLVFSAPPYDYVYQGVWGFNGLLSAGALSGFCFVLTPQSAGLGVMCALFTTCLQHVLAYSFDKIPLSVLSIPFNISTLLFLCVTTEDENTGLVRPGYITFPEQHRHDWKAKRRAAKGEIQQETCSLSGSCREKEEEAEQQKVTHEEV